MPGRAAASRRMLGHGTQIGTGAATSVLAECCGSTSQTRTPQLVDYELPVSGCDRVPELERLAAVVNPTVAAMRDVLDGHRKPVPQAGFLCSGCSFRAACAAWRP